MTWEQAVTGFAAFAFLWIWKGLHEEVRALRAWRHGIEGALPTVAAGLEALNSRVDRLDERVAALEHARSDE